MVATGGHHLCYTALLVYTFFSVIESLHSLKERKKTFAPTFKNWSYMYIIVALYRHLIIYKLQDIFKNLEQMSISAGRRLKLQYFYQFT